MFKFLNKGISTLLAITIVVLVAILAGGILAWQCWEVAKEEIVGEEVTKEEIIIPPELGILINFNISNNIITVLGSEVVSGYPDIGLQVGDFEAEVFSSSGKLLKKYEVWDPRIGLGKEMVYRDNVDFTLIFPFYDNVKIFKIKDKATKKTLISADLTETLHNYCSSRNYQNRECRILDLDNDGVKDFEDKCPLDANCF